MLPQLVVPSVGHVVLDGNITLGVLRVHGIICAEFIVIRTGEAQYTFAILNIDARTLAYSHISGFQHG